ncbi:flavin reductase family protein [Microbacterium sp. NPDC096154]|uniref:flavin reductase family protein n=1 Tax=Microbacterium sp. NPDC096154 TaxID=3155549 RepID=UPI003330EC52
MLKLMDSRLFRTVAGKFPSGVTVITTTSADGAVHGMTANGFISVSLEPPLVLVSVGEHTRTHQRLTENDRYAVNVLGHEQKPVALHFAGRPGEVAPEYEWIEGHPFIKGAISKMLCRIVDRHKAGDHTLFIGEVDFVEHSPGELPLVFSNGQLFSPLERDEQGRPLP